MRLNWKCQHSVFHKLTCAAPFEVCSTTLKRLELESRFSNLETSSPFVAKAALDDEAVRAEDLLGSSEVYGLRRKFFFEL
jgi:hypothetical protein